MTIDDDLNKSLVIGCSMHFPSFPVSTWMRCINETSERLLIVDPVEDLNSTREQN